VGLHDRPWVSDGKSGSCRGGYDRYSGVSASKTCHWSPAPATWLIAADSVFLGKDATRTGQNRQESAANACKPSPILSAAPRMTSPQLSNDIILAQQSATPHFELDACFTALRARPWSSTFARHWHERRFVICRAFLLFVCGFLAGMGLCVFHVHHSRYEIQRTGGALHLIQHFPCTLGIYAVTKIGWDLWAGKRDIMSDTPLYN